MAVVKPATSILSYSSVYYSIPADSKNQKLLHTAAKDKTPENMGITKVKNKIVGGGVRLKNIA